MELHRRPGFLRAYRFLPHRLINGVAGRLARLRRPRWLVRALVRAWVRQHGVEDAGEPATLEELFLRPLPPGARPLGPGLVSPCDGEVVDAGPLSDGARLMVKGRPTSVERLVDGPCEGYRGGSYLVIFLTPRGYHRIHMPDDGEIASCRWIPGRFFPQNADALRHIDRVYERNERLALRLLLDRPVGDGRELGLVLVGASLIGGVHLRDIPRERFARAGETALDARRSKGEEIGHFSFGSTVVLLLPRGARPALAPGATVRMGQPILDVGSG